MAWNCAVAALLGAAAGRVALDQVDLAQRRIVERAVGQLAGEHGVLEPGLLADQVARLAGRLAGPRRAHRLLDDVRARPADAPRGSCRGAR